MWRSLLPILVLGTASAINLEYLNPVKLQTETSPYVQSGTASDIINRIFQNHHLVNVQVNPALFQDNKDVCHLKVSANQLNINASSGVAALWGFNYYLKKYLKSQIEWQTRNIVYYDILPDAEEIIVANDRFRYHQNVCTVSYSYLWWNVDQWKSHVEWMALNGINLALAPVAQEAAWGRVYRQVGMTQDEIDQHFTGPAFLSWLRMGNVHGWGGPLPKSWHDQQLVIQLSVLQYMRNLGMVPVLPAFNGHVPVAFARLFPNSTFHKVDSWNDFSDQYCCDLFLDPFDPMFKVIGKMFLNELTPGKVTHIYTADPFNEVHVSKFSSTMAQQTAVQIFSTLNDYDKESVWLLQNWMFVNAPSLWPVTTVRNFLNSVPNGRMLILDLQSEQWPQYDLYQMYFGQPFIWCMLHNFGGTLGMFGNMVTINKDVYAVRSRVNSTMIGIGLTPEGINQNYVVYDLMLESAWRKTPVKDIDAWVAEYAERRYGCNTTAEAWKYLLKSVYSFHGLNRVRGKYAITRRPNFKIKPWAWYKSTDLFTALRKLLFEAGNKCTSEGYKYDVVDLTRQVLQYRAEQLYINVVSDRFSNAFVFEASIDRFLDALNDMAAILSESEYFSASAWFKSARYFGKSEDEADLYEMNARNQITMWGPRGEISDYACKQWDDLVRYYYYQRWSTFLKAALKAKENGEVFNERDVRRVIMATVETPYVNTVSRPDYSTSLRYWPNTKNLAKTLYRKWVNAPDVVDLPIIIITREPDTNTTVAEVNYEKDDEDSPTVFMYPTTPV